ncbi:TetR/AcrR family transcriptional regulator [Nocardia vaccinii]|uniref:TetR/AcrR family transcriptional regulator n=1 Tax=Nocardia vaccinii TaxID=1822 RepID=UPI001C3FB773|nr:TetR family transcriptional regulator [Nocardia vaccinii]
MRAQPLNRAVIVAAARRVADAEGLAALTLRRVAAELDTGQASLYRHITDRRELLALLNEDLALAFPVPRGGTARERLTSQWLGTHRVMLDHPWAAQVVNEPTSVTATSLPFAEAAIAAFLEAGLDESAAARAYRATWHLLIGQIVNDHPLGHPGFTVDPADYPALTAARPHLSHLDSAAEFEWSLHQLLAGILGPE